MSNSEHRQQKEEQAQTLAQKLEKFIQTRREAERTGAVPDRVAQDKQDRAILEAAKQLFQTEVPTPTSGKISPRLEKLPSSPYGNDIDYTASKKRVYDLAFQQLNQEKGSSFDNLALTAVLRRLAASNLPDGKVIATKLVATLEDQLNYYSELRRRLAAGETRTIKSGYGRNEQTYVLKDEQQLTPRLFMEKFSSWPGFRYDVGRETRGGEIKEGYTMEQLNQLRKSVGVAEFFKNEPQIVVNSLDKVPREQGKFELNKVYKVVDRDSHDNSHEILRENSLAGSSYKKTVVRHVVYFKDPSQPNQILRYSEHGLSNYESSGFTPAFITLEPSSPGIDETTIAYIEHRTK